MAEKILNAEVDELGDLIENCFRLGGLKTDYKKVERWSGREKYLSGLSVDVPKIISYDGRDTPEFRRCLTSFKGTRAQKGSWKFPETQLGLPSNSQDVDTGGGI